MHSMMGHVKWHNDKRIPITLSIGRFSFATPECHS